VEENDVPKHKAFYQKEKKRRENAKNRRRLTGQARNSAASA
jgi:hypothetical protein